MSAAIVYKGRTIDLGETFAFMAFTSNLTEAVGEENAKNYPALMDLIDYVADDEIDEKFAHALAAQAQDVLTNHSMKPHDVWILEQLAALAPDVPSE